MKIMWFKLIKPRLLSTKCQRTAFGGVLNGTYGNTMQIEPGLAPRWRRDLQLCGAFRLLQNELNHSY